MGAMDVRFLRQEFAEYADVTVTGARHEVLVWRDGTARSKEFEFESGATGRFTPAAGDVWVVPAGDRATVSVRAAEYDYAALSFPAALSESAVLLPIVNRRDPLLFQLVDRMASAARRHDAVGRLLFDSLIDATRLHVLDRYGERPVRRRATADLTPRARDRIVELLNDAADDRIDLDSLAEAEGMTTDGLRRAFVRAFGITPHRYLLDRRIARAESLLVTTTLSMTEISSTLGFASPSHFATAFKRRVGTTPSAFRERC